MYSFLWIDRTVHPITGKEDGSRWRCIASSWNDAASQWNEPNHGSWHRFYCGSHGVNSRECAHLHGCEGHHEGIIQADGLFYCTKKRGDCSKCGFKCQFDVSKLDRGEQNRFRQLTRAGRGFAIKVNSTKQVGYLKGYVVKFRKTQLVYPFCSYYYS